MLGGENGPAATGYLHPAYAHSLAEFGNPRSLPGSGGWILEGETPDAVARDAMFWLSIESLQRIRRFASSRQPPSPGKQSSRQPWDARDWE